MAMRMLVVPARAYRGSRNSAHCHALDKLARNVFSSVCLAAAVVYWM